jgi:hypothetical protein
MSDTTADPATQSQGYSVQDYIDAAQLKRDLAFSNNDLSSAMMQQSSLFSHYGVLGAQASRQVDTVKLLLENTEAAVYRLLRNEAATNGEKVTETQLEKMVLRHSRVIAMKKSLNEAKRIEAIGKIAIESFRHRRDMLVQMGLISREEMKGDISIRAKSAAEAAREDSTKQVLARRLKEANEENSRAL